MTRYDLLLQNGLLLDPGANRSRERSDIALDKGLVAEVGPWISADKANQCIDLGGRLVTPGMVDLHVHVYEGVSFLGVNADRYCLERGATTVLDAGSAGADTFQGLRRYVIDVSETRILALLNISATGMISLEVGELEDIRHADVAKAVRVCEANRDVIMGIKVRLSKDIAGGNGPIALRRALEASEAVGRPIMVHIGDTANPLSEILPLMRKGDVLTHSFTGLPNGILDPAGNVIAEAREAVSRGVILDVGHGRGSFSFGVARQAMSQGVEPGTISSDIHTLNVNGPVFDLATTASKFMHLGMDPQKVVAKVTSKPAEFLGMLGPIGTLRVGSNADLVVFDLQSGAFEFEDSYGRKETANQRLVPVLVVKAGRVRLDLLRKSGAGNS